MLVAVFSNNKISFECSQSLAECKNPIFFAKNEAIHAKNMALTKFLQMPEVSHLLLVSAEYGWKADQVANLMTANLPFVAVAAPAKMSQQFMAAGINRVIQAKNADAIFDYNITIAGKVNRRGPLLEANYAEIGFCLIRRDLVEKMAKRLYTYQFGGDKIYPFFRMTLYNPNNVGILAEHGEKKVIFGEDDEFCDQIKKAGEKIWIYTNFDLFGEFTTNFWKSMTSRQS